MSAIWPGATVGVVRTTNILAANSPFSFTSRFYLPALPAPYKTLFYRGDDPAAYSQGINISQNSGGAVFLQINATGTFVALFLLPHGWHTIQYTYDQATGVHRVIIDYFYTLTLTYDINAETITHEYLGTDSYAGDATQTRAASVREWAAVLTSGELGREGASPTIVRTADAWLNTPLATDLLGIGGLTGGDWSTFGGASSFGAQPPSARYYPTAVAPRVRIDQPLVGTWANQCFGGFSWSVVQWTWRALTDKTGQARGPIAQFQWNQVDYDWAFMRWQFGPFEAASVNTLFDMILYARTLFEDSGLSPLSDVRIKLNAYITVGETATVREVIDSDYIDGASLNPSITFLWQALQAPRTWIGTLQDGDCIMLEMGFRVVSSPPTTPATYPPTKYTDVLSRLSGCASGDPDAYVGEAFEPSTRSPWFQFSQTFLPKPTSAPPANDACADAIVITGLTPGTAWASGAIDTSGSLGTQRELFFAWTAPANGRVFVAAFQSTYNADIGVFKGGCGSGSFADDFDNTVSLAVQRSQGVAVFTAIAAQLYTIRVRTSTTTTCAPNSGGLLYLQAFYQEDPAADDLYLPCGAIGVYREGALANLSIITVGDVPSGIAFDYTRRPMDEVTGGGVNTSIRVLVALFSLDIVEIFDVLRFGTGDEEVDYISDPWNDQIVHRNNPGQLYITAAGLLTMACFGDGFLFVSGQGILPAYLNDISDDPALSAFKTISAADGDNQPGAPFTADYQAPTVEVTAPWAVTVDEVNDLAYYTSGSNYEPVGGQEVRRYNRATSASLGTWATLQAQPCRVPSVRGLQYVGAGQVLVCNGNVVQLVDSSGVVVRTYTPSLPAESQLLMDVKLTADGSAFWVVDLVTTRLFKFDLASAAELLTVPTWLVPSSLVEMAIYQPDGHSAPCPGTLGAPVIGA